MLVVQRRITTLAAPSAWNPLTSWPFPASAAADFPHHRIVPRPAVAIYREKRTPFYLVGGIPTPLKNMTSSVGMMKFPIQM